MPLALLVSASVVSLNTATVTAQTVQQPTTAVEAINPKEAIEEKLFKASTASLTKLIESQPTPLELNFKEMKDLPSDISTVGVKISGYSQYVDVEGQKVGQLILTGLEKEEKAVRLDPNKFTSQFDLEEAEIPTEKALEVNGDRAELIAALRALNKQEEEEEQVAEKEEEEKPEAAEKPASAVQNKGENSQASNYKTPERRAATPDPKEEIRTTTEGCEVRIDIAQEAAIEQSKTQTFKDGVLDSEDACSDSGTRFTLKKSYETCRDVVSLETMTATAQFTWYYVNASAARQEVSECTQDPDKIFQIVEKDACAIDIDLEAKLATPQTTLVYADNNNTETRVRDCAPSISNPAVPLIQTTDTCTIKHEFGSGISKEMGMWTYTLDGNIFQATPCTDTGVTYTHTKAYKTAAGADVCEPVIDLENNQVAKQSRVEITINGQPQYISECTPDKSGLLAIKSTTETCTNPANFEHDLAAGQSYGRERFYYENPGRIYVTECQKSEVTYPHNVETTGWQNHDDKKSSYPLSTVTITANGQPYEVAKSVVLPGESLTPYIFDRSGNEAIGVEYTGCDAMKTTADLEIYKRPDGTEFKEQIGEGTPIGPIFVCTVTAQPYWSLQSSSTRSQEVRQNHGNCGSQKLTQRIRTGVYKGFRPVSREDGVNFVQESAVTKSTNYTATQGGSCTYSEVNQGENSRFTWSFGKYPVPGYPGATATLYNQSTWDIGEGW